MGDEIDLSPEIAKLSEVKEAALKLALEHKTPSILQAAQLFFNQLDLAYLTLGNLGETVKRFSAEEAVSAAVARGDLHVLGSNESGQA